MPNVAEIDSRAEGWQPDLFKHGFLVTAVVAIVAVVIIVAIALTRPLSDTIIVALIGVVVTVAGGVINLAYIEPNKDREAGLAKEKEAREKKEELKKQLHLALYSEMITMYCTLRSTAIEYRSKNTDDKVRANFLQGLIARDLYRTLRMNDPTSFYQLDDAHAIDDFYSVTKSLLNEEPVDVERTVGDVIKDVELVLNKLRDNMYYGIIGIKKDLLIECSRDSMYRLCIDELAELLE